MPTCSGHYQTSQYMFCHGTLSTSFCSLTQCFRNRTRLSPFKYHYSMFSLHLCNKYVMLLFPRLPIKRGWRKRLKTATKKLLRSRERMTIPVQVIFISIFNLKMLLTPYQNYEIKKREIEIGESQPWRVPNSGLCCIVSSIHRVLLYSK